MLSLDAMAVAECGIHHLDAFRADTRDNEPVLKRPAYDMSDCRERNRGKRR
jgi:hypothetical protein